MGRFAFSSALIKACLFVQLKFPGELAHLSESKGTSRSLASVNIFLLRAKFWLCLGKDEGLPSSQRHPAHKQQKASQSRVLFSASWLDWRKK